MLTQDLHGHGALPCDHIRIVKGGGRRSCPFLLQRLGMQSCVGIALAMQHDLHVVATKARTASIFTCGVVVGMTMVAWQPKRLAPMATPGHGCRLKRR